MLSLFAMVAMPPAGERRQREVRMYLSQGRGSVLYLFIAKYQATLTCAYAIGHLGSLSYQFTGLSYLRLTFAISHPSTQGRSNTLPSYTLLITILIANRY